MLFQHIPNCLSISVHTVPLLNSLLYILSSGQDICMYSLIISKIFSHNNQLFPGGS